MSIKKQRAVRPGVFFTPARNRFVHLNIVPAARKACNDGFLLAEIYEHVVISVRVSMVTPHQRSRYSKMKQIYIPVLRENDSSNWAVWMPVARWGSYPE